MIRNLSAEGHAVADAAADTAAGAGGAEEASGGVAGMQGASQHSNLASPAFTINHPFHLTLPCLILPTLRTWADWAVVRNC